MQILDGNISRNVRQVILGDSNSADFRICIYLAIVTLDSYLCAEYYTALRICVILLWFPFYSGTLLALTLYTLQVLLFFEHCQTCQSLMIRFIFVKKGNKKIVLFTSTRDSL